MEVLCGESDEVQAVEMNILLVKFLVLLSYFFGCTCE